MALIQPGIPENSVANHHLSHYFLQNLQLHFPSHLFDPKRILYLHGNERPWSISPPKFTLYFQIKKIIAKYKNIYLIIT